MEQPRQAGARPQRAELIAALSLAIDLGLGLPLEHMLRSCILAMRLADLLGADAETRETAYYGGLLAWIGCHADSEEFADLLGDDVAFRAESYEVDWRGPAFAALLMRHVGTERSLPQRAARLTAFLTHARSEMLALIDSHCTSAGRLAERLGLPEHVVRGLAATFERWDGSGLPTGARGDAIPLGMRIVHLADVVEVHLAHGGPAAAIEVARARSGTQFDPALVTLFCASVDEVLPPDDAWSAVLELAPDHDQRLTADELAEVVTVMGDFVDLKCPWTAGHSRAVAALAAAAGAALGLDAAECAALERAGHVLDLGRMGVPNRVWRKPAPSTAEQERIRLHPYLSRRILARVDALRPVAGLAGTHHERLDGSGYPQGLAGPELRLAERILAAADAYRSLLEPDPLAGPVEPAQAARTLRDEVQAGRLDGPAVEAVLTAAGQRSPRRVGWPAGLTDREVTVLRLLAQGRSPALIATELHISPKTVRNHIEHIYLKIGASNRTGATLFAVSHGLLDSAADGAASS
jgi:HD-GYP domain-containing protein (c-di-GMP phosphodiesterase class II)